MFLADEGPLIRLHWPKTVCMEIVSPRLTTKMEVTQTLSDFWEGMRVHFDPTRDRQCGGHVHVTPLRAGNKFTLDELRRVAFATVYYEKEVLAVMPSHRRSNLYCRPNSAANDSGLALIRRSSGANWTTQSLGRVRDAIRNSSGAEKLAGFMQASSRYVCWNFHNTFPTVDRSGRTRHSGTVEFRGGSQFLNTKGTLAWVAFVLGFITLALEEVCCSRSNVSAPSRSR
jgi:hypothetical protein